MGMSISKRIKEAIEHSGKSQAMIAKETAKSAGAVSQWVAGGVKSLKAETAHALEQSTGVRASYLVTGRGEKFVSAMPNTARSALGVYIIPILNLKKLSNLGNLCQDDNPTSGDTLMTNRELSKFAFAITIVGNSMNPDFLEGDQVIIDPNIIPTPGTFVVAASGEHEAIFMKYRPRGFDQIGNSVFELAPLNSDFPCLRSDLQSIRIIGTAVEHRKNMKV